MVAWTQEARGCGRRRRTATCNPRMECLGKGSKATDAGAGAGSGAEVLTRYGRKTASLRLVDGTKAGKSENGNGGRIGCLLRQRQTRLRAQTLGRRPTQVSSKQRQARLQWGRRAVMSTRDLCRWRTQRGRAGFECRWDVNSSSWRETPQTVQGCRVARKVSAKRRH